MDRSCLEMYPTQPPAKSVQLNKYGRVHYSEYEMWDRRGLPRWQWDLKPTPRITIPDWVKLKHVLERTDWERDEIEGIVFLDVEVFELKVMEVMDIRGEAEIHDDD